MTVLIPSLSVAGEIVNVPTGARNITVTLPNPANEYILSGQLSTRTTCWLSGISGLEATFSFGAPTDPGSTMTLIALPAGLAGLHTVVLPPGASSYSITVPAGQYALPIVTWNTQYWYNVLGNTITFFFSAEPVTNVNFSYLIVGPGQNTQITAQPIDPAAYTATISTEISSNFLPLVVTTWNTALGVTILSDAVELGFTNGAPAFAATTALVVSVPLNVSIFPLPTPSIVPLQEPWVVSTISPEDFAIRLISLFPYPWLSDEARTIGGIAYALFLSLGNCLNYISQQLYYAWQSSRLQTAMNGALDLFAQDYFGNNLPRQTGESDNAYRMRIQALLLKPKVTRQAIVDALELAYPGIVVRPIEPWNPGDTGAYGASYYDYDSEAIPSLYGNPARRYEGWLEISLPPFQELAYKLWGYDFGAAYSGTTHAHPELNAQTGNYFLPVTALQTQVGQINNFINSIVAVGTRIWVKYINGILTPFTVGGSFNIATGLFNFSIQTPSVSGFYFFFMQLSIPLNIWQTSSSLFGFTATSSAPVTSGTKINYIAIENGTTGVGADSVLPGQFVYSRTTDAVNNVVFIQPRWNTNFWYTSRSVNKINFAFDTPAPVGQLLNFFVLRTGANAFYHSISANALTATISITVDAQDIPLCIPNWNTTVGCNPDPVNGRVVLIFNTPAPSDGTGEVMLCSYPVG